MPEAKVRLSFDEPEFNSRIKRIKEELNSLFSDANKNGNKFNEDMRKKFQSLIDEEKKLRRESQREFERNSSDINQRYRTGTIDSPERSFLLEEERFARSSRSNDLNDLKDAIDDLIETMRSNEQESRETRSVFRAFAKDQLISYTSGILNQTQSYGLMAGMNPGNIFGNTLKAASLGRNKFESIKYGLAGFAMTTIMEGITKSLRDGEEMMRAMNEVRGLGIFGDGTAGSYLHDEASHFVKYGVKGSEAARLKANFARLTGGNTNDYLQSFLFERAYGSSLSPIAQFDRSIKGGTNPSEMAVMMMRYIQGVDENFKAGNLSTLNERISTYSQLIANALITSSSVDSRGLAEIQAIFARGGGAGNNQFAGQTIMGVQQAISNPNNPAFDVLTLLAAQRVSGSNDITELRRIQERGLFGPQGRQYGAEIMSLINETTSSDRDRRAVVDQLFGKEFGIPIEERDKLLQRGFFAPSKQGAGFGDYSQLAKRNTFFGDVDETRNFNIFADIGENELIMLDNLTEGVIEILTSAGEGMLRLASYAGGEKGKQFRETLDKRKENSKKMGVIDAK